ncbi:MAG: DinB family protein [Planctomycetes bacterium]|nr:DinB family protein [Planctomycetota bacterium]
MIQSVLASTLGFMQMGRTKNVADLDQDQVNRPIMANGTTINWILGHILMARQGPHKLLGLEPPAAPEKLAAYGRGTNWNEHGADYMSFAELKDCLAASDAALKTAYEKACSEKLAGPMPESSFPFPVASFGAGLAAYQFHESYHLGQLGTARRLLGLEGGIA